MQHIICLGNLWRGDDGFGIHVFRRLNEGCLLPGNVRVIDGGVAGLQALPCFEGCRKAIVVDALTSAGKVGSVHRLELEDLCDPEAEFSLHNLGVNHLLKALPIYLGEGRRAEYRCDWSRGEQQPSPNRQADADPRG